MSWLPSSATQHSRTELLEVEPLFWSCTYNTWYYFMYLQVWSKQKVVAKFASCMKGNFDTIQRSFSTFLWRVSVLPVSIPILLSIYTIKTFIIACQVSISFLYTTIIIFNYYTIVCASRQWLFYVIVWYTDKQLYQLESNTFKCCTALVKAVISVLFVLHKGIL